MGRVLEFLPVNEKTERITSDRETTQPNRDAVDYWAQGLSRVYLSGLSTGRGYRRRRTKGRDRSSTRGREAASREEEYDRRFKVFLMLGVVLLVLWLLGFFLVKKAVGGLIHILLIIAIILIALHFLGSGGMHMS